MVVQHDPWKLVRCARCELHYLPEVPHDEAMESDFDWAGSFVNERRRRWIEHPLMRLWTLTILALKPNRERRAFRYIQRFAPKGRLLDVGCGAGRLAAMALGHGYDVFGIELSADMAAKAARRIGRHRVHLGRLQDAELSSGSFDVTVTISYLEHDPDPLGSLRRMHELLKPGGICIHKTPNFASVLRAWMGARWSGYRWPEHVQYFTPETIADLLDRAGFHCIAHRAPALGDNMWIVGRRK